MKNIPGIFLRSLTLATQKKWTGKERHDVNDNAPQEDITGIDLKHFKNSNELMEKKKIKYA
jgi:hypothetical protein